MPTAMTRRERHMRILDSFGLDRTGREIQCSMSTQELLRLLSDEGIETITRRIVSSHKRQQKYSAANRARLAASR